MTRPFPATGPLTLKANIAEYPTTAALVRGEIGSDLVQLDFAGPKLAHEGFKDMLRRNLYDVSEMAIGTFLQARHFDKPFVLLPIVVLGRFQHHCIAYNAKFGELTPQDLPGKRVGLRAYTQTTPLWVRGILQHEYGVDLNQVTWVRMDEPHLTEYADPADIVEVAPPGKSLNQMLIDGDIDAAVVGALPDDPNMRYLIPDHEAAALRWYAKYRLVPMNHLIIVTDELAATRPDAVRETFRLLVDSRNRNPEVANAPIDLTPVGIEANRKGFELAIQYAHEQRLIPHPMTVDDLFARTFELLGDLG